MLDWNDLRYVLALHRAGTLARAALDLGINATTVRRRIAAVEEQIAAKVFDHVPTGFVATRAGRDLVARAERMESEALALERELSGADQRAEGLVRLATTEMLGTRFIAPHLARFHALHPGITLDLVCSNKGADLGRREADVALRLTRPREPDVVGKALTTVPLGLYAARSYLAQAGTPRDADASLAGHAVLLFADTRAFAIENLWLTARLDGARVPLRADSVSALYSAAVAGLGIALLPRVVAEGDPALARLAAASEPEPRVVWQAVHGDLKHSARIRAVTDFLSKIVALQA